MAGLIGRVELHDEFVVALIRNGGQDKIGTVQVGSGVVPVGRILQGNGPFAPLDAVAVQGLGCGHCNYPAHVQVGATQVFKSGVAVHGEEIRRLLSGNRLRREGKQGLGIDLESHGDKKEKELNVLHWILLMIAQDSAIGNESDKEALEFRKAS